ncbi:hypothetical protein I4607_11075 [Proteus mirabilis]|uniref:hypothetical protein n=1 Tax=Proteus mirabilis TaxID=584 RepID=UPI0018C51FA9|nr:hypothetical protein [Proteus mirabilis]MBG2992181.1 hypothetical protein [Proteus mirabilis]MDC9732753.1 hypothetical protein [Proteus mirabilis]HEM8211168.1 hypothetical protein [Providencia rettgeri]
MGKIVYLDWNVFQDLIQNRRGEGLKENLDAAKRRGYKVVYSFAHMRDLSRCRKQEYIEKDLSEVSILTNNWCAGLELNKDTITYIQYPPKTIIEEIYKQQAQSHSATVSSPYLFPAYPVDMSKISPNNILTPYLKRNNGIMSCILLDELVKQLYETIFTNHKIQKQFRDSLTEVVKIGNPAFEYFLDMPIYKHLFSSKETITENLNDIVNSFLSLSCKTLDSIPFGEKITTTYNMLDFFPIFSERLQKKNNINNISTDAEHILMASDSHYLVCGDKKMLEKAKIVYRTYGIKTKVYEREEFIQRVTFT